MDNERRADLGYNAIREAGAQTNVITQETVEICISDVLAYVAHLCDRAGLNPDEMFARGMLSYHGDAEDGPPAQPILDGTTAMWHDLPVPDKPWGAV